MSEIIESIIAFVNAMGMHQANVVAITVDDKTYRRLEDDVTRKARWVSGSEDTVHPRVIVMRTAMTDVTIRSAADD